MLLSCAQQQPLKHKISCNLQGLRCLMCQYFTIPAPPWLTCWCNKGSLPVATASSTIPVTVRIRVGWGKWRADLWSSLSWFPHVDRYAATSKLSHNSGLNCSAITSYPALRLKCCGTRIPVTSPLSHMCNMATACMCANASKLSICCKSEFSEEMWQRQTLNSSEVHALMASPSVITDVFVYGRLAGTNVYTNLSQWLWPSALLLNL